MMKKAKVVLLIIVVAMVAYFIIGSLFIWGSRIYIKNKYSYLCDNETKYQNMMNEIEKIEREPQRAERFKSTGYKPEEIYELVLYDLYCRKKDPSNSYERHRLEYALMLKDIERMTAFMVDKIKSIRCDEDNNISYCDQLLDVLFRCVDHNTVFDEELLGCDLDLYEAVAIYENEHRNGGSRHYSIKKKIKNNCEGERQEQDVRPNK